MAAAPYTERFIEYFSRDVAERAAKLLADGAEIEIHVSGSDGDALETFTFTRVDGKNQVRPVAAKSPQLVFTVTPQAAEAILADTSDDIGAIGVGVAKLVVSTDANRRVAMKLKAGFLTLFSKGYFGVITAGGASFASWLASRGLNGMGAIKSALKNLKN